MDEKEKAIKYYEENVRWLKNHLPLDDVYDFGEQTLMAAEAILLRLCEYEDLDEIMEEDSALGKVVNNLYRLRTMKENNLPGIIDVSIKEMDIDFED